jgi:hypothetical protein
MKSDEGGAEDEARQVSGKMRIDKSFDLALIWESTSMLPTPGQDLISKQATTPELF